MPSVLRRCWLGSRKGTWPVENCLVGCWRGYLSGASCRLHMAQLMPLPLTVSCFSKIQTGFTFLVPARPGSPGKRAVKRVCVCSIHMQLHRNTAEHTNITLTENFRLLKISLCCQPTAKLHVWHLLLCLQLTKNHTIRIKSILMVCFQCFETVGLVSRRAAGLQKVEWWGATMALFGLKCKHLYHHLTLSKYLSRFSLVIVNKSYHMLFERHANSQFWRE